MAHRVFRLSISPERAPEVRRVVDFDGRATLHDVHNVIQDALELDNDHLYAFYLSGRYFDRRSEYSLDRDSPNDSQRSVLFRLGLNAGQQLAYLFDFGDEHRHAVTVVSIADVEAPLTAPVLVESVGVAPPQYADDEGEEPYELPAHLAEVVPLAETVLTLSERLDVLHDEDQDDAELDEDEPAAPTDTIVSLLRDLSKAALDLARALKEDEQALHELDEWSQERELLARVLTLPTALMSVGEMDSGLAVARAFTFGAAESLSGDVAIILAESGKRSEALAQVETNLEQFPDSALTAIKSGAALEALRDTERAEASYRRALVLAEDDREEEAAFDMLAGLLEDAERFEELHELMSPSADEPLPRAKPSIDVAPLAAVGRNDACPCGSGKKYKKCHGA